VPTSNTPPPRGQSKQSWRDVLPIHSAADLFPLMSPDELRELGKDIKNNGLASPIAVCMASATDDPASLQLVDGRNRFDAMELVGLRFKLKFPKTDIPHLRWKGLDDLDNFSRIHVVPPDEAFTYVISANIHRRHLTAEQKRNLIGKLIKATPEKPDRQIAETVKVSPTTVGTVHTKMEAKGDVCKLDTRTDSKGREQPAGKPRNLARAKIYREMKLGSDVMKKIKGTSLDSAREMDALVFLNRGAEQGGHTEEVERLVADAVAGKRVSAVVWRENGVPPREDIGPASTGEMQAAYGQPADDDPPSETEWKPKCLAHPPVASRLEMLVGLLQDGLTPIDRLVWALANASLKRQSQLEGLEGMVGAIFNWMSIVKDEVAEIRRVLVAYEQRDTEPAFVAKQLDADETNAPGNVPAIEAADLAPPADDGLDIPPSLRRTA
jgi:hypothetical protein